ncbi:MAG TPA: hypothetical protein VMM18_08900 [Gemmatimonadaceae bacterium]|nr:hypothetical protein [Gemmatimonadaceae bacterium]
MRMWIGAITFVAGVLLLFSTHRERDTLPPWFRRLPLGVVFLGAGTLLLSLEGTAFAILSAICSGTAVVIFGKVVWTLLRRR